MVPHLQRARPAVRARATRHTVPADRAAAAAAAPAGETAGPALARRVQASAEGASVK